MVIGNFSIINNSDIRKEAGKLFFLPLTFYRLYSYKVLLMEL